MAAILSFNFLAFASLVWVFAVWTGRIFWMNRFRSSNTPLEPFAKLLSDAPKVTVIVPAKNEEKNIPNCLYHLFRQNYSNYEIIVVDDRSEDRTPHLLENFKKLSPVPLKIIRIEKLPEGWTGKNYGMFVASKAAAGSWFLYTDADTTHRPESVLTAVRTALEGSIDFLTLAPETECRSFWEKTVQPLAVSSLALWFNSNRVNDDKNPAVLANGQYILVKKNVYERLGGNESVKNQVIEDVELAKLARAKGFCVRFLNGTLLYSTRMYSSLGEIKTGWTRIFTYLFNKNPWAILHKIFLFLFFSLWPFALCGAEKLFWLKRSPYFNAQILILSAIVCAWVILVRFFGNRLIKSNPWYAFLHPLGSLIMLWILGTCLIRILFNRPSVWKGQYYR